MRCVVDARHAPAVSPRRAAAAPRAAAAMAAASVSAAPPSVLGAGQRLVVLAADEGLDALARDVVVELERRALHEVGRRRHEGARPGRGRGPASGSGWRR